jgi:hypothetical protein
MAFQEDLDVYFSDFGTDVVIAGNSIKAIFDNPYSGAFGGLVTETGSTLTISEIGNAAVGTTVLIDGSTYTIAAIEPDGTGLFVLRLK